MSDKDDLHGKKPEDAGNEDDALGLDLSADPEFLALAADFDAAVTRRKQEEKPAPQAQEPPQEPVREPGQEPDAEQGGVDFVLVEPPQEPEVEAQKAAPATGGEKKKSFPFSRFGLGKKSEKILVEPVTESSEELSGESPEEPAEEPDAETSDMSPGMSTSEPLAARQPEKDAPVAAKMQRLGSPPQAGATFMSRLFDTLALGGILVLAAVFICQVFPGLQSGRLLWYSDELRQADVLAGVFQGNWLQIHLNGQLYQEAPPLYFWFLMGLHRLLGLFGLDLGTDYAQLLFIGAALSGFLFLLATFYLARSTARLDRRGALAAGCVLLSVLFLVFFFHYSSLDLFFAAFIIFSHIFLFKALLRPRAPLYMGLAFLCAAVALMSKGALGLALPVLSAVLFCLWRGTPGRLLRGDFLLGVLFALVPAAIWLGSIWATGQHQLVLEILEKQIWVKAFGDTAHREPWWYYLALLPAMWLPWSIVLLALPWQRLFSPSAWSSLKGTRTGERQGLAFVWIFFLGAFAFISAIGHKQPVYLVPLMGPLAVLTGRAVLQLSPLRSAVLQRLLAVLFFLLAVAFVLLPVYYSGSIPSFFSWLEKLALPEWEIKINGIFLLAVVMLGTACLLLGVIKARRPESTLLIALLGATLFSYPLGSMTMPSLDAVVSSRAASVELRRYADLGYYPVSFKVYSGVFSYYSGMVINETNDWAALERMVEANPRIVVAMNAGRWEGWTQNPGFTEIMRFWMLSNEYVLLLRNTLHEEAEPEKPELPGPQPESPLPEEAAPEGTMPEETAPVETAPEEAIPSEPAPAEAAPVESGPEETAPAAPGAEVSPEPAAPAEEAPERQDEIPLPDATPAVDSPLPQDPHAPVPAE